MIHDLKSWAANHVPQGTQLHGFARRQNPMGTEWKQGASHSAPPLWYISAIMLKGLAIFGLLLLITPICAQEPLPVKGGHEQEKSQPQTDTPDPAAPQPCTSEVCKENAENAERYAYYKAHPKEYLKAAIAPANLSNWILAGLGAIGGALAILTLLVIKRQADLMKEQSAILGNSVTAAQKAADAAEESALAAMGVAVPTLMVVSFKFSLDRGKAIQSFFQRPKIEIAVKNFGQTPAFPRTFSVSFSTDPLPGEPVYDPHPFIFMMEESFEPGVTHQLDESMLESLRLIPAESIQPLVAGEKHLIAFGYLGYDDIFGSPTRYMKFSKCLIDFGADQSWQLPMDIGGEKYTGQRESIDPPKTEQRHNPR